MADKLDAVAKAFDAVLAAEDDVADAKRTLETREDAVDQRRDDLINAITAAKLIGHVLIYDGRAYTTAIGSHSTRATIDRITSKVTAIARYTATDSGQDSQA